MTICLEALPQQTEDNLIAPDEAFPEIFMAVALSDDPRVLKVDPKALVDGIPVYGSLAKMQAYLDECQQSPDFDPVDFWFSAFFIPDYGHDASVEAMGDTEGLTMEEYIDKTWENLAYYQEYDCGSLLKTEHAEFKPGERYPEAYYWDTARVLAGLIAEAEQNNDSAKWEAIIRQLDSFAKRIDRFGFIGNGNRTYYQSRSQPPMFANMVKQVAEHIPEVAKYYLPRMVKEYKWWTKGETQLDPENGIYAADHSVMMPDGEILNRYWDTKDTPRPESFKADVETAMKLPAKDRSRFFRNVRGMAASGRDMTGEYMEVPGKLETACTERCVPVDLNSLLWEYESDIADVCGRMDPNELAALCAEMDWPSDIAQQFQTKADARAAAINKYLWNGDENTGYYSVYRFDEDFRGGAPTGYRSATMAYPVARGIAPVRRAVSVCTILYRDFLKRWGYVASLTETGEQWDAPNTWAPDQDEINAAMIKTAELTGEDIWKKMASIGRAHWISGHKLIYELKRVLVEKSRCEGDPIKVVDGEYPLQRGFGWTNGILRKFLRMIVDCPTLYLMKESQLNGSRHVGAAASTALVEVAS